MNNPTNFAQDVLAWLFAFCTAAAGLASLEKWALIIGIVCTVFTTFSSYNYRKATLKATLIKAHIKDVGNK